MTFFLFDVSNRWVEQQFYCHAEDLISAHMRAIEFAALLQQRIKEEFNEDLPTTVKAIGEWQVWTTNEAGIELFLNEVKDYLVVED